MKNIPRFLGYLLVYLMMSFTNQPPLVKGGNIYFVIKPQLKKDVLLQIDAKLTKVGITLTYRSLRYEANKLVSVDLEFDLPDPDSDVVAYNFKEQFKANKNEAMIFYYTQKGKRVGIAYESANELNAYEKQLAKENLIGLLIENKGNREVLGSWKRR